MDNNKRNTASETVRNKHQDEQPESNERLWKAESEIPYRSSENKESKRAEEGRAEAGQQERTVNKNQQENQNYLTKEDLPDATNESKGKVGSGLRQDSN